MKVLHIVSNLDDRYGGPSSSVPSLVHAVSALGVGGEIFYIRTVENEYNTLVEKYGLANTGFPGYLIGSGIYFSPQFYAAVRRRVREVDLVHLHGIWRFPAAAAAHAARAAGTPIICSPRSSLMTESLKRSRAKKFLARTVFADRALHAARYIHVTSEKESSDVLKYSPFLQPRFIPNGVSIPDCLGTAIPCDGTDFLLAGQQVPNDGKRNVVFFGRVHPRKGLHYLLEAWERLSPELRSRCRLIVAGHVEDQDYFDALKRKHHPLFECEEVVCLGHVGGRDKATLFALADIFAFPTDFENFGLGIAEALYACKPVITTDGTPWEAVRSAKAGWVTGARSVAELRDAVDAALALSPSELERMGARGRAIADRFRWESLAPRYVEMYEDVVGSQRRCFGVG